MQNLMLQAIVYVIKYRILLNHYFATDTLLDSFVEIYFNASDFEDLKSQQYSDSIW